MPDPMSDSHLLVEDARPMDCVYCDRPLDCQSCGETYAPPGPAEYAAMSRPEVPVICPVCGSTLVCRWCRTPYDGRGDEDDADILD